MKLDNENEGIRLYAVTALHNKFNFDSNSLDEESFSLFKNQAFSMLEKEGSKIVRGKICKLIAGIAGSEIPQENVLWSTKWREFFGKLFGLIMSDNQERVLEGLSILDEYFPFDSESFTDNLPQIQQLLLKLFGSTEHDVLHQAVLTAASVLPCVGTKEEKKLKDLSLPLLKIPLQVMKTDLSRAVEILDEIAGIAEVCKGFFAPKLNENVDFVKKEIENKDNDFDIRMGYFELLVNIFSQNKKKLEKNLKDYITLCFNTNIEGLKDPDDAWNNPVGSEVDDEEIGKQMQGFDRLMGVANPTKSLPIIKNLLLGSLRKDWKHKYISIMLASQIGEYLEDHNDINDLIEVFLGFQDDENPKVRFAVYHVFGQYADDLGQPFIEKNSHIVPKLFKGIEDSSPRVISHCLFCLGNLFEDGASQDIAVKCLEQYFEKLIKLIGDPEKLTLVRESALTCISGMSETAGDQFTPYFNKGVEVIYRILKGDDTTATTQVRSQCIEAITLFGCAVGKEEFKKISGDVIKAMIDIMDNELEMKGETGYVEYIASGFQRILMTLEADIQEYIDFIMPYMSKLLHAASNKSIGEEEIKKILDFFTVLLEQFPSKVASELSKFLDYGKIILDSYPHLIEVSDFIGSVFKGIVKSPELMQNQSEYSIKFCKILDILGDQLCSDVPNFADSIKNIIEDAGELLDEIGVITLLKNINTFVEEIMTQLTNGADDKEEEDEEAEEEDKKGSWEDVTKLVEIIGQTFKKKPNLTQDFMCQSMKTFIPKLYGEGEKGKIPAIYLLDDILEVVDYSRVADPLPNCLKILLESAADEDDGIRQAAVFGLGMFAKFSGAVFQEFAFNVLVSLKKAIEFPGESTKNYDYAKDNAIAALGRVVKHQLATLGDTGIQVGGYWVDQLPLKRDKVEGREQHELLLDIILTQNASMVFGPNGEKMKKVLEIFGTIVNSKMSKPEIDAKIEQVLKGLMANEVMSELLVKAGSELDDKKKAALGKFFSK